LQFLHKASSINPNFPTLTFILLVDLSKQPKASQITLLSSFSPLLSEVIEVALDNSNNSYGRLMQEH
jgi:hypothetical protein